MKKRKRSLLSRSCPPDISSAPTLVPQIEFVPTYDGVLQSLHSSLEDFLRAEGLDPEGMVEGGARLTDSLLTTAEHNMGLDWKQRETLQARLKVACKRVLIQFGSAPDKAEDAAERLVTWLRAQGPDVANISPQAPAGVGGSVA